MNVVFIGAHADDIEFSVSGTFHKHKDIGDTIYYMVMSECENLPRNKSLPKEVERAMRYAKPDHELRLNLKNKRLGNTINRERMREAMENLRDDIGIDLVYTHWLEDIHQDHQAVAEETIRVFRHTNILQYENVHSTPHFNPDYYIQLEHKHVIFKLSLIKLFKSQSSLYYANPDVIENMLRFRGFQVKTEFAEAFIVWRMVV